MVVVCLQPRNQGYHFSVDYWANKLPVQLFLAELTGAPLRDSLKIEETKKVHVTGYRIRRLETVKQVRMCAACHAHL